MPESLPAHKIWSQARRILNDLEEMDDDDPRAAQLLSWLAGILADNGVSPAPLPDNPHAQMAYGPR